MAIGKEEMSGNKIRKYLENCQLTCKRALQLLCFSLLSKLWDYKKENNYTLSSDQADTCKNFFDNEFEWDIKSFTNLLKTLMDIYTDNQLELPIVELNESTLPLDAQSHFITACNQLQTIDKLLDTFAYTVDDCIEAESNLTTVLETLKFLVNYKMVSIKSISYLEMRNSKPHYLYNYTALGVESKSNINQERVNYAETPINTDAVLLYRGSYYQHVNLFPFVIDENALKFEGGAKICFYTCRDNTDGSLNYNFLEDNSIVKIDNKENVKPGIDNKAINELLINPQTLSEMKLNSVYTLFQEAKKAVTGMEDEEEFENPF